MALIGAHATVTGGLATGGLSYAAAVGAEVIINLGSADPVVAERSADAVGHALGRGAEIGARGVVVHTGSAVGWADAEPAARRERALRRVTNLLLEPMAGQGQMLCAEAGDLSAYLTALDRHPKVGVCLDTCHLFAAGHDLTAPGEVPSTLPA